MEGKILQSSRDTLFLDDIGSMPLDSQTQLLRILEAQEVVQLGAQATVKTDLRVISTSRRDLRSMVRRGTFREDLYYRIIGITFALPPLAMRADKERLILGVLAAENCDRPASIE